jgi:hypothetical protein
MSIVKGRPMPPYNFSPAVNTPVRLLQPGVPGYAFGSFDASAPTTLMQVSNVALASNVATVTVLLREGKIPAVGSLLTIRGTDTASGAFNVVNEAIGTVTIDSVTGIGTITFNLTHADVVSNPDAGQGYVPVPEIGEALTGTNAVPQSSQAFAIQDIAGHNENGLTINWSVYFPSAPSTAVIALECADVDQDNQYVMVDSTNSTSIDNRSYVDTRFRFVRLKATGVAGGASPTVVGRINI